jgi:Na+/H+ antiporter NhaD/arsenite permease-like protein
LASVTGPNTETIKGAYAGLKEYFSVSGGEVTEAQIELAVLLGNANLSQYVVAISVAAVFFGANTYIGNGPNFMVKSIADQQKVHAPSFLAYFFKFSIPIMMPVVTVIWLIFFY